MIGLVLLGLGCPAPPDDETPPYLTPSDTAVPIGPCGIPTFELGSGAGAHFALRDGDEVVMVHGAQGGWHLDVSGRLNAVGADLAVAPVVVRTEDGLQIAGDQSPTYVDGAAVDTCTREFAGVRAFLDDFDPGDDSVLDFLCALDGATLTLDVAVTDVAARVVLEQTREVVVRPDPADYCELR